MGISIIKTGVFIRARLRKLFYKLVYGKQISFGKNFGFRRNFILYIEKGGSVEIGEGSYFNNNVSINCLEKIKIGKRCMIGEGVKLYDHNHRFRDLTKSIPEQGFTTKPITIGDDCWICSNVTILQGVTIGDHSVIGANCLVYKDVPPHTIVKSGAGMTMVPIEPKGE